MTAILPAPVLCAVPEHFEACPMCAQTVSILRDYVDHRRRRDLPDTLHRAIAYGAQADLARTMIGLIRNWWREEQRAETE